MRTRILLITTIVAMLLFIPAAAGAALVDEQRQGQNLIAQLGAGTKTCSDLSADDLDHIGEYVMFKAPGSTKVHQAMNDRMVQMMGEPAETRMHQLLGARYAGCSTRGLGIAGHVTGQPGGHRIPRFLRGLGHQTARHSQNGPDSHRHDEPYTAENTSRADLVEQLSAARENLSGIAELTDRQFDTVPPKGSFRFCDGQRTLEQVLTALLKHQDHQVRAIQAALSPIQ